MTVSEAMQIDLSLQALSDLVRDLRATTERLEKANKQFIAITQEIQDELPTTNQ